MKQTAVEWLEYHISDLVAEYKLKTLFEQAKEMEHEQIADAQANAISKADMTNNRVCVCKNRQDQFKRNDVWICGDCEEEIKQRR